MPLNAIRGLARIKALWTSAVAALDRNLSRLRGKPAIEQLRSLFAGLDVRTGSPSLDQLSVPVAFVALFLALAASGLLDRVDRALEDMRYGLAQHRASGDVLLIEVDSASLDRIGVWPWPRSTHAKLVDRLVQGGVSDIAFDIDFSQPSTPKEDAAFAAALERAGGSVILPAFRQPFSGNHGPVTVVTTPHPQFARHAWPALVNVQTDRNGLVRRIVAGAAESDLVGVSLVEVLGGRILRDQVTFKPDFSISAASLPRVSYIDVLDGTVDPSRLAGRIVIVGASAIELGDHFAVPAQGIVSGAALQAIGVESLRRNRVVTTAGLLVQLAGLAALGFLCFRFPVMQVWPTARFAVPATMLLVEMIAYLVQSYGTIVLRTTAWQLMLAACLVYALLKAFDRHKGRAAGAISRSRTDAQLLHQVLQDGLDGIIIADRHGSIRKMNPAAFRLAGLAPDSVPDGTLLQDALPVALGSVLMPAVREAFASPSGRSRRDIELPRPGGVQYLEAAAASSQIGTERDDKVVTLTLRDVTERRRRDLELLAEARRTRESALLKSALLKQARTGLQEPLDAVLGGTSDDAPVGGQAAELALARHRFLATIDGVVNLLGLEANTLVLDESVTDPVELIDAAVDRLRSVGGLSGCRIRTEAVSEDCFIRCDKALMVDAIADLVGLAVERSGGDHVISLSAALLRNGCLEIAIADGGSESAGRPSGDRPLLHGAMAKAYLEAHGAGFVDSDRSGESGTMLISVPRNRVVLRSAAVA